MVHHKYKVVAGPEGYFPPAAAEKGVVLPENGQALIEGTIVSEEEAMRFIVDKLWSAKNPVFFPGSMLLWDWKPGIRNKAQAVKELADTLNARIIPMPDYRPKYPMINPDYTPCPTNMKFPSNKTVEIAKKAQENYYFCEEYFSEEAQAFLGDNNTNTGC